MKSIVTAILAIALAGALATAAEARKDSRRYDGFRTGQCKSSSCYAKHPGGSYVYPNHYGKKRW